MEYRRYVIMIAPKHHGWLPPDLLTEFGCSVCQPSNWLTPGMTLERGLTFLDVQGHELDSNVFVHVPIFLKSPDNHPEKREIHDFVCKRIQEVYQIDPATINVQVANY